MSEQDKVPGHPDLERLDWECDELGVTLACFFEYEPESVGSREVGTGLQLEPDYPATYTLMHVYTPEGLDISAVMDRRLLSEIEEWAEEHFEGAWEEDEREAAGEAAYEAWLDRRGGDLW